MLIIKTDILVVGSGLAGTLFVLELAQKRKDLNITLICNKNEKYSSSYLAQGGIAAVLPDTDDSIEQHIEDTMSAGAYVNDRQVVDYFISRSTEAVSYLEKWGVKFDLDEDGNRDTAREGGHKRARVLHHKDFTGKHIMQKLQTELDKIPNLRFIKHAEIYELIKSENEEIEGAYIWDAQKRTTLSLQCSAVVMCTGGLGNLFNYTTNPTTANGQGIALCAAAGAIPKDLMYIQYHPTALYKNEGNQLALITEALRGAGAVLRNEEGVAFMKGVHPQADIASRDIVARAIINELEKQSLPFVYLDATSLSKKQWKEHFPNILQICEREGIDPFNNYIPVVPASHYSCGGIEAGVSGITNIPGLFVLGETACTGLHGANRLASNSLLEATLMATTLAKSMALSNFNKPQEDIPIAPWLYSNSESRSLATQYMQRLKEIMQTYSAVIRSNSGLQTAHSLLLELQAKAEMHFLSHSYDWKKINLSLQAAILIVEFSINAKENKGVFYNSDLNESFLEKQILNG